MLINFAAVTALAAAVAYYAAARGWQLRRNFPSLGASNEIDFRALRALGRLETGLLSGLTALFLAMLGAGFWLGRYDLLLSDRGNLMVGLDYIQQTVGLPFQTLKAGAAILAAILVLAKRRKLAMACALVLVLDIAVPPLMSALYVRPNELALETPFIKRHIEATRTAFGLDRKGQEREYAVQQDAKVDFAGNRPLLDNVRLWDWRAFHDTITQKQPLRPYAYD